MTLQLVEGVYGSQSFRAAGIRLNRLFPAGSYTVAFVREHNHYVIEVTRPLFAALKG